MDGFTYNNIFDTKGIEYLVVIAFLLLLIPFWLALNKQVKIKERVQKALGVLSASLLRIPQGIFYSKNHTWTYLEKSGVARVGLDDLLLHITGEVKFVDLKNPGEFIYKGELLTRIDQNGKVLDIFSPISGKILNINPELNENPEMLIEDPYGLGWVYKIKPSNWVEDTKTYYLAEDATKWSAEEVERFKDFLAQEASKYSDEPALMVLQDGGELCNNILSEMPTEIWKDFQKSFLSQKL